MTRPRYANIFCITDNPSEDANVRGDPFKTLIVARLSYDANESDLEKEFGRFGPIERVSSMPCISIIGIYTYQKPRSA